MRNWIHLGLGIAWTGLAIYKFFVTKDVHGGMLALILAHLNLDTKETRE